MTAARFAADSVSIAPGTALRALEQISTRYTNPVRSIDELLDLLSSRYGMRHAVAMVREAT